MNTKFLASIFVLSLSACNAKEEKTFDDEYIAVAGMAINLCVKSYEDMTNSDVDNDIDRAYVLRNTGEMQILFSSGEAGLFGERDENYSARIFCAVESPPSMEVYFLGNPSRRTLLEKREITPIIENLNGQELWDLLFLRDEEIFEFAKGQSIYDEDIRWKYGR